MTKIRYASHSSICPTHPHSQFWPNFNPDNADSGDKTDNADNADRTDNADKTDNADNKGNADNANIASWPIPYEICNNLWRQRKRKRTHQNARFNGAE